jgi:hypothetical protein
MLMLQVMHSFHIGRLTRGRNPEWIGRARRVGASKAAHLSSRLRHFANSAFAGAWAGSVVSRVAGSLESSGDACGEHVRLTPRTNDQRHSPGVHNSDTCWTSNRDRASIGSRVHPPFGNESVSLDTSFAPRPYRIYEANGQRRVRRDGVSASNDLNDCAARRPLATTLHW